MDDSFWTGSDPTIKYKDSDANLSVSHVALQNAMSYPGQTTIENGGTGFFSFSGLGTENPNNTRYKKTPVLTNFIVEDTNMN